MAQQLGVERIGPQHQAGSDSLLTSATFMKLVNTHLKGLDEARSYLGVLFQLGGGGSEAGTVPVTVGGPAGDPTA